MKMEKSEVVCIEKNAFGSKSEKNGEKLVQNEENEKPKLIKSR